MVAIFTAVSFRRTAVELMNDRELMPDRGYAPQG